MKNNSILKNKNIDNMDIAILNNGNLFIAYQSIGNNNYGTLTIVNGNGDVVKEATVFNSAATYDISTTILSNGSDGNDHVLIAYTIGNSCYGYYIILDSNGDVVRPATLFNNYATYDISATTLSNGNVLIAYRNADNNYGYYTILDTSGSVIKTATVFNSAETYHISATALSNGNVLIAYNNYGDNYNKKYCIIKLDKFISKIKEK